MRYLFLVLLIAFSYINSFPQIENIPADNDVYDYLKRMQVKGIIPGYDDIVLPIANSSVKDLLLQIQSNQEKLSYTDLSLLNKYLETFEISEQPLNLFSDFEKNIESDRIKHLYYYNDSLVRFTVNPLLGARSIYSSEESASAYLGLFGGQLYGSYNDWLGFYLEGSNEVLWGDRETALLDPTVAQSFTFNETEINFIDNTSGYMRFAKDDVSIQIGRERLIWGSGYDQRMILSNNPQLFDFIRFDFAYKSFNYKFIHGWLVQPPISIEVDSLLTIKDKPSKYIAISRLGFNPFDELKLGLSQFVIYSNRPFEAAYLNPLLFWESAQRSMNDLDNSFLSLDLKYLISDGIELTSSILLDDVHFGRLFEEGWDVVSNRNAWNASLYLTDPLIFSNMFFHFDYVQVRPYMFSHPGVGEMLTYTNNSYLLGTPYDPNSSNFNLKLGYYFSSALMFDVNYNYRLHGDNVRDSEGNVIRNVGGNIYEYYTYYDESEISLLEGIQEISNSLSFNLKYEPVYFVYINAGYTRLKTMDSSDNIIELSLNFRNL